MTAAIEFNRVSKTYRRFLGGLRIPALWDVSFRVMPGEICAFLERHQ
jgi:ABC-type multidrug transport system ATPase subunit